MFRVGARRDLPHLNEKRSNHLHQLSLLLRLNAPEDPLKHVVSVGVLEESEDRSRDHDLLDEFASVFRRGGENCLLADV